MSSKLVDERVVQMNFDNKNFEKNVKESMNTIEELKASLDFSAIEIAAISAISNITDKITDMSLSLVKSLSIDNITAGWSEYENELISTGTLINQLMNNAEFKSQVLAKNASASLSDIEEEATTFANNLLSKLTVFSDETSMSFNDMLTAMNTASSSGIVSIEDAQKAMMFISEWFTSVGKDETAAAAAYNKFATALNTGVFTYGQWQNIVNRGGITNSIINEQLVAAAVQEQKLTKLIDGTYQIGEKIYSLEELFNEEALNTSQWLSSDVFIRASKNMVDPLYDAIDAIDNENDSLIAVLANQELVAKIFSGNDVAANLAKATTEARTLSQAMTATKKAVVSSWKNIFKSIFGTYEEAKQLWTRFSLDMWTQFVGPFKNVEGIVARWNARGGWNMLFSLDENNTGLFFKLLYNLFDLVNAVFSGVGELFNTTGDELFIATVNLKNFITKISPTKELLESISNISKSIFGIVKKLTTAIKPLFNPLMKFLGIIGNTMGDITTKVAAFFEDNTFFTRMAGYLTVITEKISELFDQLASNENLIYVLNKISTIAEYLLGMFINLIDIVGTFITGFDAAGENAMNGFIEGLKSGSKKVKEAVEQIATKIIKWFKDILGIHSPSVVFESLGEFSIEGFIKGLGNKAGELYNKIKLFIDTLLSTIQTKFEQFGTKVQDIVDKITQPFKDWYDKVIIWAEENKIKDKFTAFFAKIGEEIKWAYEELKKFNKENKKFERIGLGIESIYKTLIYVIEKVFDLIAQISDKIKEYNDNLITNDKANGFFVALYNFALSLGKILTLVIGLIQSFIDKINETINSQIAEKPEDSPLYSIVISLSNLFSALLSLLQRVAPLIAKAIDYITEKINSLFTENQNGSEMNTLKTFFVSLGDLFKVIAEVLTSVFTITTELIKKAKESEKAKGITEVVLILSGIVLALIAVSNLSWSLSVTKKILQPLKSFAIVMDSIAYYLNSSALAMYGKIILNVGEALALIITSIIAISALDWKKLIPGVAIIVIIFSAIITMVAIITSSNKKIIEMAKIANGIDKEAVRSFTSLNASLLATGAGVLLIAGALLLMVRSFNNLTKLFIEYDPDALWKSIGVIAGFITLIFAFSTIMAALSKASVTSGTNLILASASMAILMLSITVLTRMIAKTGDSVTTAVEMVKPFFTGLCVLYVAIALGYFLLIKNIANAEKKITDKMVHRIFSSFSSIGMGILLISAAMLTIITAIKIASKIDTNQLLRGLNVLIPVTLIIVIIILAIGKASAKIPAANAKGVFASFKFTEIATAIVILVGALWLINSALGSLKPEDFWKSFGKLVLISLLMSFLINLATIVNGFVSKIIGAKGDANSTRVIGKLLLVSGIIAAIAAFLYFIKTYNILEKDPEWVVGLTVVVGVIVTAILSIIALITKLKKADVVSAEGAKFTKTIFSIVGVIGMLAVILATVTGFVNIINKFKRWDDVVQAAYVLVGIFVALGVVIKAFGKLGDVIIKLQSTSIKSYVLPLISLITIMSSIVGSIIALSYLTNSINNTNIDGLASCFITLAIVMSYAITAMKLLTTIDSMGIQPGIITSIIAFSIQCMTLIEMLSQVANLLKSNEKIFSNHTLITNFAIFATTLSSVLVGFGFASIAIAAYSKYIFIALGVMSAFTGAIISYAFAIKVLASAADKLASSQKDISNTSTDMSNSITEMQNNMELAELEAKIILFFEKAKIAIKSSGEGIVSVLREFFTQFNDVVIEAGDGVTNTIITLTDKITDALAALITGLSPRKLFKKIIKNEGEEVIDSIDSFFTMIFGKDNVVSKTLAEMAQNNLDDMDLTTTINVEYVVDDSQLKALEELDTKTTKKWTLRNLMPTSTSELQEIINKEQIVSNYVNITVNESNTPEETADTIAKKLYSMTERSKSLYN